MVQINIKTNEQNLEVVRKLTNKLPTGSKENIIARIALSYSLSTGKKYSSNDFSIYDSKGKEYKDHILFDAKSRDYYIALICQHYSLYKTNENISKYIKLHIDHGLSLLDQLFENNENYSILDFLSEHLTKGISYLDTLDVSLDHVKNNNQSIEKSYYISPLKIKVGSEIENNEPIYLNINDTNKYNNCHIAVAGNTGTGKTQFGLDILRQIVSETKGNVNFIYLDFKGLKGDDLKYYKPFFDKTNAIYIDAPQISFPINPITFIDNINEKNKIMGINKFVDIIAKYSNIGKKQQQKLKDATKEVFRNTKNGEYPTLQEINEKLLEIIGDAKDTLTEIMESLTEVELFENIKYSNNSFFSSNYYFSLSGELSNSVRFTAVFLIINYIYNIFMNMENTPVEDNNKGIRYILLIDEAHVIFKDRKSKDILEKILREIRSKGVSIMLLSQGIEEFHQPSFDFSSMCEMSFLLDIKDKSNIKMINRFMGFGDNLSSKVARSMERIQKGQAISNIKEFTSAKLFKLNQIKDNN